MDFLAAGGVAVLPVIFLAEAALIDIDEVLFFFVLYFLKVLGYLFFVLLLVDRRFFYG